MSLKCLTPSLSNLTCKAKDNRHTAIEIILQSKTSLYSRMQIFLLLNDLIQQLFITKQ